VSWNWLAVGTVVALLVPGCRPSSPGQADGSSVHLDAATDGTEELSFDEVLRRKAQRRGGPATHGTVGALSPGYADEPPSPQIHGIARAILEAAGQLRRTRWIVGGCCKDKPRTFRVAYEDDTKFVRLSDVEGQTEWSLSGPSPEVLTMREGGRQASLRVHIVRTGPTTAEAEIGSGGLCDREMVKVRLRGGRWFPDWASFERPTVRLFGDAVIPNFACSSDSECTGRVRALECKTFPHLAECVRPIGDWPRTWCEFHHQRWDQARRAWVTMSNEGRCSNATRCRASPDCRKGQFCIPVDPVFNLTNGELEDRGVCSSKLPPVSGSARR